MCSLVKTGCCIQHLSYVTTPLDPNHTMCLHLTGIVTNILTTVVRNKKANGAK